MGEHNIAFDIQWYGWDGKVYATEQIKRHDLSEAIVAACNLLARGKGQAASAHGFFVTSHKEVVRDSLS